MGVEEGAAYGAALLAGVAAAIYPDLEAASQLTRVRETIEPDRSTRSVYDELFGTYLTLYPGLSGAMHAL